jgi:hypothetical protein
MKTAAKGTATPKMLGNTGLGLLPQHFFILIFLIILFLFCLFRVLYLYCFILFYLCLCAGFIIGSYALKPAR